MNNDLISREELKAHISELMLIYNGEELDNAILNAIDNASTVELLIGRMVNGVIIPIKRPQGEWLHSYITDIACECSNCHIQMPITDYFNFCPNCGAKMKSGTELYREETCKNKYKCDDYKYWHCVGCNGCKKGGAENDT